MVSYCQRFSRTNIWKFQVGNNFYNAIALQYLLELNTKGLDRKIQTLKFQFITSQIISSLTSAIEWFTMRKILVEKAIQFLKKSLKG